MCRSEYCDPAVVRQEEGKLKAKVDDPPGVGLEDVLGQRGEDGGVREVQLRVRPRHVAPRGAVPVGPGVPGTRGFPSQCVSRQRLL